MILSVRRSGGEGKKQLGVPRKRPSASRDCGIDELALESGLRRGILAA